MKKKLKTIQITLILAILLMLQCCFSTCVNAANSEPNFYSGAYENGYLWGGYGGQCTWYVWSRAKEVLGIELPEKGSGLAYARSGETYQGYKWGSTPMENSIAAWDYGNFGHVVYVEAVNGNQITFSEANWNPYTTKWIYSLQEAIGWYRGKKTLSEGEFKARSGGTFKGFLYLDENTTKRGDMAIDGPAMGATRFDTASDTTNITVWGWAVSNDPNAYLEIYIDDKKVDCDIKREQREQAVINIANSYGGMTKNPGYITKINISNLSKGNHVIKVVEKSSSGKEIVSKIRKINITNTPVVSFGNEFVSQIIPTSNTNLAIGENGAVAKSNVLVQNNTKVQGQYWKFKKNLDKTYTITNLESGLCLEVDNSQDVDAANVSVNTLDSSSAQKWYIYNYNGNYRLVPKCSLTNKGLDIYGANFTEGANIGIHSKLRNNNVAQIFNIEKVDPNELPAEIPETMVSRIINTKTKNDIIMTEQTLKNITNSNNPNTNYEFIKQTDGAYVIKTFGDGKYLYNENSNIVLKDSLDETDSAYKWQVISSKIDNYYGYQIISMSNAELAIGMGNKGTIVGLKSKTQTTDTLVLLETNDTEDLKVTIPYENVKLISYANQNLALSMDRGDILVEEVANITAQVWTLKQKSSDLKVRIGNYEELEMFSNVYIDENGQYGRDGYDTYWIMSKNENGTYTFTLSGTNKTIQINDGKFLIAERSNNANEQFLIDEYLSENQENELTIECTDLLISRINKREQCTAYINGNMLTDVTWKSTNPNVATISENGTLTSVGGGVTTIIATSNLYKTTNSIMVYVSVPVTLSTGEKIYPGDLSEDGLMDSADAAMILNKIHYSQNSADDLAIADLDGNGKLTRRDADLVLEIYKYNIPLDLDRSKLTTLKTFETLDSDYIKLNANSNLEDISTIEKFPILEDTKYLVKSHNSFGNEKTATDVIGSREKITIQNKSGDEVAEYDVIVSGDINGDGSVQLYDSLKILQQSILGGYISEDNLLIMDYDEDGEVKLYDSLKILQQAILGN